MPFKPLHQAHAIERFRILIQFATPLSDKVLARSYSSIVQNYESLGFDAVEGATSLIGGQELSIGQQLVQFSSHASAAIMNGKSVKRLDASEIVEEFTMRDLRFGYTSTQYGRWANAKKRFWELAGVPLANAIESVSIESIRLEYWDKFIFDGPHLEARPDGLLRAVDVRFPSSVHSGQSPFHSYAGWFLDAPENHYLVNINIEAKDEKPEDGSVERVVNFYNFAEFRANGIDTDIERSKSVLDRLHNISTQTFGSVLNDHMLSLIGMNLQDYDK